MKVTGTVRPGTVPLLALALIAALTYGHLLAPGRVPAGEFSDFAAQHVATKTVLWDAVNGEGRLPLWRADQFAGMSAFTNPQASYTHPLHLPFLFVAPERALGWSLFLHFLSAGCGYFLLGRVLGLGPAASTLTGVFGLVNFKLQLAAFAGWIPVMPALVCLPFLAAAVVCLWRSPGRRTLVGLALALTLALHSGQPQVLYLAALCVALAALPWLPAKVACLRRSVPWAAAALALALGLCAYLYGPFLSEVALSSRGEASYARYLMNHALSLEGLTTFVFPEALGTPLEGTYATAHSGPELWEDVAYFGIVPLTLALVALCARRRSGMVRFLALGSLVSVLLAFDSPVAEALHAAIPGFALFRGPTRFLFVTSFLGTVLAGFGAQWLLARLASRAGVGWSRGVLILLIGAAACEGTYYARRYLQTRPAESVAPVLDYGELLRAGDEGWRTAPLGRFPLNYAWAAGMGAELVTGSDPLLYEHYQEYFQIMRTGRVGRAVPRSWLDLDTVQRPDLLNALSVKHIVSHVPLAGAPRAWRLVQVFRSQPAFRFYVGFERADVYVYENTAALPRAHFPPAVEYVADVPAMTERLIAGPLRERAIIRVPTPRPGPASFSGTAGVRTLSRAPGHIRFATRTESTRPLVLAEVWHPGWRARVDGEPVPLQQTNLALMSVELPPGEHELTLTFVPPTWPWALYLSALALALLGALAFWGRRSRGTT